MKKISFVIALLLGAPALFAQKPPLTIEAIKSWTTITHEKISNDGKLVTYIIERKEAEDTLVIQHIDQRHVEKIPGGTTAFITENNQWVIYKKADSLFIYDTQQRRLVNAFGEIYSFKTPTAGNGKWLAFLTGSADKKLALYNLAGKKIVTYDHVVNNLFSPNGNVLLLQRRENANNMADDVQWIDLTNGKTITILHNGLTTANFTFDAAGEQLAFTAGEMKNGNSSTRLMYYTTGMDSAMSRVNNNTPGLDSRFTVAGDVIRFSANGDKIFFRLKRNTSKNTRTPTPAAVADVTIWNYDDDFLPTEQAVISNVENTRTYTAVLQKGDNKIIQLDQENDDRFVELDNKGDFALIRQNSSTYFNGKWKSSPIPSYYILNIKNGQRKQVIAQRDLSLSISPAGKYITWYDPLKKTFLTYETETSQVKDITPHLAGTLCPVLQTMRLQPVIPVGMAGWLANDKAVLIYDEFDIWQIDPKGEKAPVNITNGYGKRHHTMLRVWYPDNSDFSAPIVESGQLLLVAFNIENKNNGFFKTTIAAGKDPVKLCMDPYLYYAHRRFNCQFLSSHSMIKAKNADAWLIRRMNSIDYPNIYYTRDCKQFVALSDVHPQQNYNWLTSEPITWQQPDGTTGEGILYKPENFDPQKKYPVIFYFYEKLSYRLHQFLKPELSGGSIDIPFYVSNGYLVCTPDILYRPGYTGESAYNSVASAARHLSQLPWVDGARMGLQGHSFGGYQVNYIVSRTNMFAAAQPSSGASDFISYYNGFYREHSAQFYFEFGQGRLGYTLWEKPELYVQNSPVFKANQVSTPLLIMHNKDDGEVPFQQGVEWFTALRRLGKKVWMLQYEKEYHSINQQKNKADFTIKAMQFFDHFLKGAPAPKWMGTRR